MIRRLLDASADPRWDGWVVISWLLVALAVALPIFLAVARP